MRNVKTHAAVEEIKMQKIKCNKGKCWDEESDKKKIRSNCKDDDVVCQTEADLIEENL